MRVFFDENVPRPLRAVLAGHDISYVEREGWKGKENGELLALVAGSFDVIVTSDGSMGYQQELVGRDLSMIVLPTNNLTRLRANAVAIRLTLDDIAALDHHVAVTIDWRGRRIVQRLDQFAAATIDLPAVPPFGR